MTSLAKYNASIGRRRAKIYRSPTSWMQPSLHMLNNKVSEVKSDQQARPAFATIDDAIQKAEALLDDLKKLGERKYPLDVRKAGRKAAQKEVRLTFGGYGNKRDSVQVRDGKRTYF